MSDRARDSTRDAEEALRRTAEQRLSAELLGDDPQLNGEVGGHPSHAALRKLIHELRVHQVELRMQNDELRRSQEETLVARSELYDLFNHAPVGYAVVDEHGLVVQVNETLAVMVDQDPLSLVSKPFVRLLAERDHRLFLARFRAISRKPERKQIECRLVATHDGLERPVVITARTHPSEDEAPRLLLTITDISERKQVEEALRYEKERAQQYLDVAATTLIAIDAHQRITLINPAGCELLGYAADELLGQNWFELCVPAGERAKVMQVFNRIIAGDVEEVAYFEHDVVRKDGSRRQVAWHNSVLRDGPEQNVGLFSSGVDISDKRRIEVQLAQADRMASIGLVAAGVAHEINNPLTYLLYHAGILAEDLPELADGVKASKQLDLTDLVGRARSAAEGAERIQVIVQRLRVFTHVDEERLESLTLADVVDSAVEMATNEVRFRARLVTKHEPADPLVANAGQLCQVFLNLLVNAAHAIEEGDVEGNEIRVHSRQEGDELVVEVEDTGRGIAPENMDRVFEPFFTTKEIGTGSGLGLSICQRIVGTHGGQLSVRSTVGEGTCFTVRLPVGHRESTREASPEEPTPVSSGVRGRVLVIDDEPMIREVVAVMLEEHEITQASSGTEARDRIAAGERYDVMICDLMMPHFTGMDLHGWLEANHPDLAERVIFITGGVFTPKARELFQHVSNPCLEKPVKANELRSLVAQQIASRQGP
ncbi:MAG: PAS domain S-box protein [Planctomycetota bacterium]|nr:PAS domain S-box protein [Planctomycetota bacterium]